MLVADGIFSYTLQVTRELAPELARDRALAKGREFVAAYERVVAPLRRRCKFTWIVMSDLMAADAFSRYSKTLQRLYESDGDYRGLVDGFAEVYLGRILQRQTPASERAKLRKWDCARTYLIEECAAFSVLCEAGPTRMLYPGSVATFRAIGQLPGVPVPLQRLRLDSVRLNRSGFYLADSEEHEFPAPVPAPGQDPVDRERARDTALSERDWQRLCAYTIAKRFLAGDMLTRAGETSGRSLYILERGAVEVLQRDREEDARWHQVAIHRPHSIIGEEDFVASGTSKVTIAALGDCDVQVLSQKRFERMQRNDPALARALREDIERILALQHRPVEGRGDGVC